MGEGEEKYERGKKGNRVRGNIREKEVEEERIRGSNDLVRQGTRFHVVHEVLRFNNTS